ncbi:MAG: peptidoglycan editing factor PgeF [Anaerolineae bacterium]
MQRIQVDDLVFYCFEQVAAVGLIHGVFTRRGGVSEAPYASLNVGATVGDRLEHVQINRERMAAALDVREADIRTAWQVHSADVLVVRRGDVQDWPPPPADALITADAGVPLAMRFADCVPLLLYDPVRRVLGLAHAGWRGTIAGVGPATVETMAAAFGSQPADIIAGIGPSIGPQHYEVGPEVAARIREAFDDTAGLLRPSGRDGHAYLDLWEANRRMLAAAGVQQIEVAGICTYEHVDEFYSHRAEHGRTGRFGMLAVLGDGG